MLYNGNPYLCRHRETENMLEQMARVATEGFWYLVWILWMSVVNRETNESDTWSRKVSLEAWLEIMVGLEMWQSKLGCKKTVRALWDGPSPTDLRAAGWVWYRSKLSFPAICPKDELKQPNTCWLLKNKLTLKIRFWLKFYFFKIRFVSFVQLNMKPLQMKFEDVHRKHFML